MAYPFLSKLKFLKSQWLWVSILGICCIGGYASYVYWISQLDDKELRAEHREWAIGLLFPVVVGGGGYWLNQQSEKRAKAEQDKAETEAENERKSREAEAKNERNLREQLARDERNLREKLARDERDEQREQSELKDYFDRISTLVVDKGLTKCDEEAEQYQIARALTANILRELTTERMNQVMFFLGSLNLSGKPIKTKETNSEGESELPKRSVSLLKGIDLSNTNLENLNGGGIDLSETDLTGAKLGGAKLGRADLAGAELWRANLGEADLAGAYLWGANLSGANLRGAYLMEAYFFLANLSGANLSGANLWGTNFSGAKLWETNFSEANLMEAQLSEANLRRANFSGADLSGADLSGANLVKANFSGAKLEKTILSEHLTEEQQKQCAVYEPILVELEKGTYKGWYP